MDAPWRVEMLGGLRATQGESVVTRFRSHQAAGLLAYLAFYRHRPHPREELIERFWPERDPESGRNSFRVALSSLRRQLEPPGVPAGVVLVADRASLQLNPAAAVTDVAQFEAAIGSAGRPGTAREKADRLAEAVELYRGELLPGFFDDWVLPERRRLDEAFHHALEQMVAHHEQNGELAGALQYARRAVAADVLREAAHSNVIRLLIAAGQPEAALRQYEELERLLARELEAEPAPEIRALARRIREQGTVRRQAPDETRLATGVEGPLRQNAVVSLPTVPPSSSPVAAHSSADPLAASSPPTGTVTFLLSDIEGSAALSERDEEAAAPAHPYPHMLLRQAFRQHGGWEVKDRGDGFLAAFQRAGDALACAIAGQRALAAVAGPAGMEPETPSGQQARNPARLRVRMALHTGDAALEAGGYHGPALHCVQRILDAGHRGQILCSEETAALLRRELSPGVRLTDLGVFRLRDVNTPEQLFQIDYPDQAVDSFPPLNAAPAHTGRLPLQFTRYIGREQEITRLNELLSADSRTPARRLITLTGPGGTGKTRLALEVARQQCDRLHGAVWFVPLADLRSPEMILDKLLDAMHLPRSSQVDPLEQVITTLSRQPSLLLLDSFEHLIVDGLPLVETLLERVPALVMLATSRQRLGLPSEQEFPLAPLPVPGIADSGTTPARPLSTTDHYPLSTVPSVALFLDRAQAARQDFQMTAHNAAAIAELCRKLEGLPLAIELAAAWARILTPEQMLVRLEQRFELLVRRGREVDPRHGSLRATLDSSYHALAPELQQFFAGLSVFRGGWTLDAAEAVSGDFGLPATSTAPDGRTSFSDPIQNPNSKIQNPALKYLGQLCDCSLVLAEETPESSALASGPAEMRYRLLETLREYAAEQLTAEQRARLARRHAAYFCALAERAEPELQGPGQVVWLARLEREHDNLRAALGWAEGQEWGERPADALEAGDIEIGLRLAGALWEFWAPRGYVMEGREHLAKLLALPEAAPRTAVRAKALACAAILADLQGEHAAARSLHEEALVIRREIGDRWGITFSLTALGYVAEHQGDYPAARAFQEEALALSRERNDPVGIAWSLSNLADVAWHQGDYVAARSYFQESLEIRRKSGDYWGAAFSQSGMGTMALNLGDLEAARLLHEASLAIRRELGDKRGVSTSVTNLGHVARRQGDCAAARALLEEGLAIQQELGDQGAAADSLYGLGCVALKEGNGETARRLLEESLSLQRELGNRQALAGCLEALAGMMAAFPERVRRTRGDERFVRATRLLGAAAALREAIGAPLPPVDRDEHASHLDTLWSALGEPAFTVAWEAGCALTVEQAVTEALGAGMRDRDKYHEEGSGS